MRKQIKKIVDRSYVKREPRKIIKEKAPKKTKATKATA
jgi:hypothetical protein